MAGEISGASSMILEHAPFGRRGFYAELHAAGRAGRADPGRRRVPAAGALHARATPSTAGAGAFPFLLSFVVIVAGYIIRREVAETPAFAEESEHGDGAEGAGRSRRSPRAGATCCASSAWSLMNVIPVVTTIFGAAYAVQPGYGIGFSKDVYLWIPVLGNIVAVARDPVRRQPVRTRSAAGRRSSSARSRSGLLSFGYLYAISIHNVPLAIVMSLLMWGVVYQGYNAVFPSFYPEMFPTRTRVSGMAISQNLGTARHRAAAGAVRHGGASRRGRHPDDDRRDHARHLRRRGDRGLHRARDLASPPQRSRQQERRAGAPSRVPAVARRGRRDHEPARGAKLIRRPRGRACGRCSRAAIRWPLGAVPSSPPAARLPNSRFSRCTASSTKVKTTGITSRLEEGRRDQAADHDDRHRRAKARVGADAERDRHHAGAHRDRRHRRSAGRACGRRRAAPPCATCPSRAAP